MMIMPTKAGVVMMPPSSKPWWSDKVAMQYVSRTALVSGGTIKGGIVKSEDVYVFPCTLTVNPTVFPRLSIRCPFCAKTTMINKTAAVQMPDMFIICDQSDCRRLFVTIVIEPDHPLAFSSLANNIERPGDHQSGDWQYIEYKSA